MAEGVRNALLTCGFREENKHPDGVIVIGGDGTFLFAVHQYMDILKETVFIGIHSGTLGFYMDYRDTEISEFLTDIIPGNLPVEEYPILEAQVGVQTFYAVNEIRIENPMRTQNLNLYLDNVSFEQFRGTGLCVSTQLGSTAFNRSLGGAVLQKGLPLFEITEMADIHRSQFHSLGAPFVIADNTKIRLDSDNFEGAIIGADVHVAQLSECKEIKIQESKEKILRILRGRKISYFERLARLS
ncbi:MAG: NAD(+)/NADH kinase [Absicoccus sp.]|uniref:NAD(+)/NADH kinase n=1 Tax=Absicoccus sp. TaxID=2718527 RepID=UPI002A756583|nr:NAD(+)/NADH kinase [Absicoccus sp.]MDY3034653.1 NAD(+)/NADH kinase [Absicoccus sp.]